MRKHLRTTRRMTAFGAIAVGVVAAFLPILEADALVVATRISGADRYATSAAISQQSFQPGVSTAFIATGTNFPDALAGAPIAAKAGGPVLLVPPGSLPASTATELDRLDPGKIIVIGGTTAVSQTVQDQLQQYTAGTVTRIQGASRWETAAALSASSGGFSPGVARVYVTTGGNFPDALAGGPAAFQAPGGGAPLLLVESGSIPAATATELQRLAAQKIIVLGGTGAVSDAVVTQLDTFSVEPVTRLSGADRFLTSVIISGATFTSANSNTVYLATGRNFPDALSGGSPAGRAPGPMLLSEGSCIPPSVNDEISRLDPDSLVILGGESALTAAVAARTVCLPPTTTTTSTTLPTNCTPGYTPCMAPNLGDWDCAGGGGNGPNFIQGPVFVGGDDPYDLDQDGNGIACEVD